MKSRLGSKSPGAGRGCEPRTGSYFHRRDAETQRLARQTAGIAEAKENEYSKLENRIASTRFTS
jgi:hypothetical protein